MLKSLKKKGSSIPEALITGVIFVIAAVGILTTMSMLSPKTKAITGELKALHAGEAIIYELISNVSAETWDCSVAGRYRTGHDYTITTDNFVINYTLTDVPNLNARKLQMTITYDM